MNTFSDPKEDLTMLIDKKNWLRWRWKKVFFQLLINVYTYRDWNI